jgi:hypothetical protein
MTSPKNIGVAAADALRARDWRGVRYRELLGPRDYTLREATTIVGRSIGKPDLQYVGFSDDGFVQGLQQAGFSADVARRFIELSQANNERRITMATSLEDFAPEFAVAYGKPAVSLEP